jgi:GTPase SAR1 family protein
MIITKNKETKFYLYADQNCVPKYGSQGITYKVIQDLCTQHDVEFKNQTIVQLTRELCDKFINTQNQRKKFSREERVEFLLAHPSCEIDDCGKTLTMSNFEIDHIHPLSAGGTNEPENLQALCKECHFDKTQLEKDNNEHIKLSSTYSSFSESVTEIFNSPLNQHLAFVEIVDRGENYELCNLCAKVKSEYEGLNGYYCKSCYDSIDKLETKINDRYTSWLKKYKRECSLKDFILNFDCGSEQDMKDNQIYIKLLKQQEKVLLELELESEKNEYCIDVNGCRRECLYNNPYNIPLFTVMDMPKKYNSTMKDLSRCIIYIESSNYMPLRGNGWYYYPLVKLCLDEGIISHDNIKYVIKASLVTKRDHFNGFIDWCKTNMGEYSKLCINSMIGFFAIDKESTYWKNIGLTEDISEAYNLFIQYSSAFITTRQSSRGDFYVVSKQNKNINIETEKEIYNYIIDLEIVQLYKLRKIIEAKGGKILEYKTDSIRFKIDGEFPFKLLDDKNLDGYFYDSECTKPIYKIEHKGKLQVEMKPKYLRTDKFTFQKPSFSIIDDVVDNNFEPLVSKIVDELGDCFITGIAGAGKTTLINQVKNYLTKKGLKYNCLCPTNISKLLVDGETLDKFLFKMRSESIILNSIFDYVIVDEISMVKEMFFKMLSLIKRYKPNTKFILSGHYDQFLPVKDRVGERSENYYKNSGVFHELCSSNMVELTKCRRSDEKHFNYCKNVDSVKPSDYGNKYCDLHISWTNKKRIQINRDMMVKKYDEACRDIDLKNIEIENDNKRKKKNKNFGKLAYPLKISLAKYHFSNVSQNVDLFVGVPIMAIKNKNDVYVNGEQFIISNIDNDNIIATSQISGNEITIEVKNFQRNFHVAYCITSHKSQGSTFTKPYTIHEWSRLNKRCKYVSLSRSTTWENCNILDV